MNYDLVPDRKVMMNLLNIIILKNNITYLPSELSYKQVNLLLGQSIHPQVNTKFKVIIIHCFTLGILTPLAGKTLQRFIRQAYRSVQRFSTVGLDS